MSSQCTPPSYFSTPEFLLLALHGATAISIPIHSFAFYCVLFKTPDQMKSVKWYLVNLSIWIVLYDYSVCLLTVPMLLLPSMSGYTLGVLTEIGVPSIVQTIMVFIFLEYVLISILAIFENRFNTVCNYHWKSSWSPVRHAWLGLHYLTGILVMIPFGFLTPRDQNAARKKVFEQIPCLPDYVHQANVIVTADEYTYHLSSLVSFLVTGVLQSCFFILSTIFNTIQQLRTKKMSRMLFEIQKKFFIALVIQIMVPLLFLIIPLNYSIYSVLFNYYNQGYTNIFVTMEASHGLVSSLVMIFIHRPYRDTFFNLFSRGMRGMGKNSIVMNQSQVNDNNNRIVPLNIISLNKV